MMSPDRNLSLDWSLVYYAIHSRSTTPEGMPRVSEELISAKYSEELQGLEGIGMEDTENQLEFFREREIRSSNAVDKDIEKDGELRLFWTRMNQLKLALTASGAYTSLGIESVFDNVHILAEFLQAQSEIDQLKQSFPGI